MSSHPDDATGRVGIPPHPALTAYYSSPGERQAVVNGLFDDSARYYDWICRTMSMGTGSRYRRSALRRVGLRPGMRLLDVATGTGLVAREALAILGGGRQVVGLDPSAGMLGECHNVIPGRLVRGVGEALPFRDRQFDVLSMGYALRHVSDLAPAFQEYHRVLKNGGRVVIMEIVCPRSRLGGLVLRLLLEHVLPFVTRIGTGSERAEKLMRYYWETVVNCVSPQVVLDALGRAGFAKVEQRRLGVVLSEYVGTRP
jgi:demethylmenaquinone methyltransferase / 2-methoxy-6-polyprenyl-1,4-benzoquinol methylase